MKIDKIIDNQISALKKLKFSPPVSHVYNPLEYARVSHDIYLHQFGKPEKEIVFLGMNPGPWGMAQTGVPFGEIEIVKTWMKIESPVKQPKKLHSKRPVEGFSCSRSEVSGKRLWGWAKKRFKTPDNFFSRFFVANYCPLVFMEESGKNRTPDKLKKEEKEKLFRICDKALCELIEFLKPQWVIGVGAFSENMAKSALQNMEIKIGRICHPSPANPKANRGWEVVVEKELFELGIILP